MPLCTIENWHIRFALAVLAARYLDRVRRSNRAVSDRVATRLSVRYWDAAADLRRPPFSLENETPFPATAPFYTDWRGLPC